ncbi:phosphotransferase family protein [Pseudonocardia sp. TRM90224]|uniref:phosphotransferase family protein n=1 Tax=Pseudonocardia sp. TRM90224 TaxID=2812678 RepID=UPI001E57071A|nr:phosphotransferase [Pseudonocardia sp. TRM90224]
MTASASEQLVEALTAVGCEAAPTAVDPVVLSERAGRLVVRVGDVVVKAHAVGTDPDALAARLRLVADRQQPGPVWLPPVGGVRHVRDRLVTVWPAAETVAGADPDSAPWVEGAELLARLHRCALPADVPAAGFAAGVERAVTRMGTGSAADAVRRAFRGLGLPHGGSAVVHGDWHLGQVVHHGGWRLIDVDDLGLGDPAWDLARPAALYAVGLLDPVLWARFLDAYRAAEGPAVPATGDPWPVLDTPARAAVIRLAAQAVVRAGSTEMDETDVLLVDACVRMSEDRR